MEFRNGIHPADFASYDTNRIRQELLIQEIFNDDEVKLVYSHIDRIIIGGVKPVNKELKLEIGQEIGVEYFLARREMGVINIGGQGSVEVDGEKYVLNKKDGLYIGKGH